MDNTVMFSHGVTVRLNLHPRSLKSAEAASQIGIPLIFGVMAKDYANLTGAVEQATKLASAGLLASVGLGDGDAGQWERALRIALQVKPAHLNQVFPAAGLSAWALRNVGADTLVNALVSPTRRAGYVRVATGPRSSAAPGGELAVGTALDMLTEVGVNSVKVYPLKDRLGELAAVAEAAAERGMVVEPTGGITPESLNGILRACLNAGATRIMPHLYGSVRDPQTGDLDISRISAAGEVVAALCGQE